MTDRKTLYLVVPCYNEEEVLPETARQLTDKLAYLVDAKKIKEDSRIVFINDGSKDRTWSIIKELHQDNPVILGIDLSRNRGQQNAVLAGLMAAKEYADMAISLDADLQDDIHAIDNMIEEHYNGYDVVYGVRSNRRTDTFFKRFTAQTFYKLMLQLGVDIVYNHPEYRLMSKRALDGLEDFREVNLFLRGIVPLIGYPSNQVYYERNERFAGKSKYPIKKLLSLSIDGITSFSIKPIRLITTLGMSIFLVSIGMLAYSLASFFTGYTIPGWSSTIVSIWAIGGLQLLAIGVIGEYIGKIYMEAKGRPKFIIKEFLK